MSGKRCRFDVYSTGLLDSSTYRDLRILAPAVTLRFVYALMRPVASLSLRMQLRKYFSSPDFLYNVAIVALVLNTGKVSETSGIARRKLFAFLFFFFGLWGCVLVFGFWAFYG